MRLRRIIGSIALFCVLFGPTPVSKAQIITDAPQSDISQPQPGVARTVDGKEIGSVIDFIVDPASGRLIFAVVSSVKTGKTPQSVAFLPWHLARVNSTGMVFDFMISAQTLRNTPRLPAKKWQKVLSRHWLKVVDKYWTTHLTQRASLLPPSGATLCRATALIGVPVRGEAQTELGTIRQLVLDDDDRAIALVILAHPITADHSHTEFVKVPWEQLYVEPRAGTVFAFESNRVAA